MDLFHCWLFIGSCPRSPKSICSGALVFINAPTLTRQLEICFCSLFNYADKSLGNAFIQICGRSRNGEIFVGKTPHLAVVHCKHEWSCLNKGVYKPLFENHLLPGCDAAFRSGLVFLLIFFFKQMVKYLLMQFNFITALSVFIFPLWSS